MKKSPEEIESPRAQTFNFRKGDTHESVLLWGIAMISYAPLWETMKRKNATTYTLRNKGKPYNVGGATMEQLKAGLPVSTTTLDAICNILNCTIPEIIEFMPEESQSLSS